MAVQLVVDAVGRCMARRGQATRCDARISLTDDVPVDGGFEDGLRCHRRMLRVLHARRGASGPSRCMRSHAVAATLFAVWPRLDRP